MSFQGTNNMEEEYKKIDEIINKVLASNGVIGIAKQMHAVFREIAKAALNEGLKLDIESGMIQYTSLN